MTWLFDILMFQVVNITFGSLLTLLLAAIMAIQLPWKLEYPCLEVLSRISIKLKLKLQYFHMK